MEALWFPNRVGVGVECNVQLYLLVENEVIIKPQTVKLHVEVAQILVNP